jgi:hypothetical protein
MDPGQPLTGGGKVTGPALREEPAGGEALGTARRSRIWRPALLARFPRFFWRPSVDAEWVDDWPVVRRQQLAEYPALAEDLAVWLEQLEPRFRRLDHRAQILQNQFWRENLTLIVGGLVATSLGAVQAAVGGGVVGLAGAQAVLTGVLAGLTVLIRSRRAQQGYLTVRLKAERIKSEFFVFLARAGDYAGENPQTRLLQQVDDIEAAEGVT